MTGFPPPGTATVVNLPVPSSAFVAGGQKNNVLKRATAEPACEIVMGEILDADRKASRGGRTRLTILTAKQTPRHPLQRRSQEPSKMRRPSLAPPTPLRGP